MGECTGTAFTVARLLLGLRWPAALSASLQEVCKHLTFALHTDLATAHKIVVIGDEAIDVLCYLVEAHRRLMSFMTKYFTMTHLRHDKNEQEIAQVNI